jgi:PAS domain S-box-containing protein
MKKTQLFKSVSEILSICIFLGGSAVLIGWILDIPALKSISPDFVAMKANTAICFILIGLSLWLSQTKRQGNRAARRIARLCAFVVFMTGFLSFLEYMLGRNFGIDQLLFKESVTAILTSSPGRMAFNTSIIFMTIGISLLLCGFETALFAYLAQLLVIPAGIIALLSFVGYLYGASPLYIGLKFSTAMAVHNCVLSMMSCMGCLFVRPEQGLMKNISCDNYGGIVLRRILPVVIVIPLVLGWFEIYGGKTGLFGNEFGVSLVATCDLLVVSLFVYILSVYLNRLDNKRKQTEDALIVNKTKLDLSLQSSKMGVWEFNIVENKRSFDNQACSLLGIDPAMFGGSAEEFFAMVHPDDREKVKAVLKQAIERNVHYEPEYRAVWPDGSVHYITARGKLLHDDKGNPQRINGVIWDITERKRLEEELKSNTEMKSKFTSMVSHELRSPLGVIKEGINLVLEGLAGNINDEQKDLLDTAKRNTDRLGRLINNVLDLQKIESGKMAFDIRKNDINEAVLEVNKAMSLLAKGKGLDLVVDADDSIPKVRFDKDKIIQVLTNLVSNAIKYTEKGNITISTKQEDNTVHVIVQDTGMGIKAEDMEKLFCAFEQLNGTRDKKKGGTGLGLAISNEIILAHKGKIWAESEAGKGSSFHFILPIKERRSV